LREGGGRADLILLDVPCSTTAVLGRRPEARYRASQSQLDRLAGIQRQIIADAIPLLSPQGAILYSTCSLEPEENDQQAAWARKWHKCQVSAPLRLEPSGRPGAGGSASYADAAFAVLLGGFGGCSAVGGAKLCHRPRRQRIPFPQRCPFPARRFHATQAMARSVLPSSSARGRNTDRADARRMVIAGDCGPGDAGRRPRRGRWHTP